MHPARRVAARAVIAIVILAVTAACQTTQGAQTRPVETPSPDAGHIRRRTQRQRPEPRARGVR